MASQAQMNTTSVSGSDSHWRVAASLSPVLILSASQEQRVFATIFNDAVGSLYLQYGGNVGMANTGSAGMYDVKLTSGTYYEIAKPIWEGEIWGVWDAVPGFARVLQLGRPDK